MQRMSSPATASPSVFTCPGDVMEVSYHHVLLPPVSEEAGYWYALEKGAGGALDLTKSMSFIDNL